MKSVINTSMIILLVHDQYWVDFNANKGISACVFSGQFSRRVRQDDQMASATLTKFTSIYHWTEQRLWENIGLGESKNQMSFIVVLIHNLRCHKQVEWQTTIHDYASLQL